MLMEDKKQPLKDLPSNAKQKLFTTKVQTLIGNPMISGCDGTYSNRNKIDGPADIATLENPADILCSSDRKMVCFCDLGSHTIRVFDLDKKELKTIFGSGTYGSEDGDPTGCSFAFPHGLAFSMDESYIFVADTNNHAIRCLDLQKQLCTTIVGLERKRGTLGGTLDQALMAEPRGIAMNPNGNLIVSTCSAIYSLDLDNNKATILAGKDAAGFKDGKVEEALFDHPDGVVCINNLIFVADTYNHRIRVINLEPGDRTVSTYAGTGEAGHQDGSCLRATFKFPQKIKCWADEKHKLLYVTELNDSVRVIDLMRRTVYTLAGNLGTLQNGFLDGAGDTSLFNFPYGIDVLDENTIIVSDSDNHSLRVISILGREEPVKPKPEPKPVKPAKAAKLIEEPAKPPVVSSALEMLQNSAKEAAKNIRASIIEILLTYTSNPAKQTLCSLLGLVHVILHGEKKKYDTMEDVQGLLKRPTLKDEMLNLRVENVLHTNSIYLIKQLTLLKKNDDCKLPGIRVIYKWLVEVGKAVSYYNDKAMIKKEPTLPAASRDNSEKKGIPTEAQKELNKLQDLLKEKDKTIEELKEDNESLKATNGNLKAELKQFKDQFLTLMKLMETILDDETLAVPSQISINQFK